MTVQTPIAFYILTASSLSVWFEEPTNPLSSDAINYYKFRPEPLHDALGFVIYCFVGLALTLLFAAWKTKKDKIGASGYMSFLLTAVFFGMPMIAAAQLFAQDVLHNMGYVDSRDFGVPTLNLFAYGELPGLILGIAVILISTVLLTWKKTKPKATARMCTVAAIAAVSYIILGLVRLALIQIKPEWIYEPFQHHFHLIGTGVALLSVSIGLRWTMGAIYKNRENAASQANKSAITA
jgi:hypothetical protein